MNREISDLNSAREYLGKEMARVRKLHYQGASGTAVVEARTQVVDILIKSLYQNVGKGKYQGPFALIALGGYGRGELNPHSDVDLLFLHGDSRDKGIAGMVDPILYVLWDTGLDVGHSIGSVEQSVDLAKKDSTVRTSLIDLRFLEGDRGFFRAYKEHVFREIYRRDVHAFVMEKITERIKRYEKYGSSVYLQEPNIKEGEGGLRDIHTVQWIARVFYGREGLWDLPEEGPLSREGIKRLLEKREFIWRLRNELHFLSKRKNDQLSFEYQERAARNLGYRNTKESLAVELLMRNYYRCATEIKQFASEFVEGFTPPPPFTGRKKQIVDGFEVTSRGLTIPEKKIIKKPVLMMKAFLVGQSRGVEISGELRASIRKNLFLVDGSFRKDPEVRDVFRRIILSGRAFEILQGMHELRLLGRFIPEFERIYCRAQHDVYHVYTVDTHSLFALGELEKVKRGEYQRAYPLLSQVAQQVEVYEGLIMAALLHDIGKGWGRGHVERGTKVVPAILSRLGFSKSVKDAVSFLVKNHLLMAHVAQRRDIHEERTIHTIVRAVKNHENLRMLYLLTFADLKAVGPESWTDWRSALLRDLYLKAMEELEEGGTRGPWRARQEAKIRRRREGARKLLLTEYPKEFVEEFLDGFHHGYFFVYSPMEIARHARVYSHLTKDPPFSITKVDHPRRGYSEVILTTWDTPGLLSKVAGVFASKNVNILGVRINVRRDRKVMDTYHINDFQKKALTDESRWEKVKNDLAGVLKGSINVEDLVARGRRPSIVKERMARRIPSKVIVDNHSSDLCTIVDVYTHDRPGLLYTITNTLYRLGLYIAISKISTKVDQVADVFYVQDLEGRKIMDRKKLDEIVAKLRGAIDAA